MADTTTSYLRLTKPEVGQSRDTWGNKYNANCDLIDAEAQQRKIAADSQGASIANLLARIATLESWFVPGRSIQVYWGQYAQIPAGWQLCDGTNNTPDLRDKFIFSSNGNNAGAQGGAWSQTVGTTAAGGHSHGGATLGAALTEAQMPSHQHGGATDGQGDHSHNLASGVWNNGDGNGGNSTAAGGAQRMYQGGGNTYNAGNHAHNLATDWRGGNQAHSHGLWWDGDHAHTLSVSTVPPYITLAYIMRMY